MLKVKAIRLGYYEHQRRYPEVSDEKTGVISPADEFFIKDESDFSYDWMEAIGWTPTKPRKPEVETPLRVLNPKPAPKVEPTAPVSLQETEVI